MNYSKREAKLKKEKKNKISLLCPLSCRLSHKCTSTLHIALATQNCGISSKWGVHPPGYTQCTPPHKPHSLLSWTILLSCLTSKPLFLKHSFSISIHLFLGLLTEQLSLSILSIWLNHCRIPSSILSSRPFFTLHNSLICAFWILSILLIPSNPLRLSICTVLTLDLSFSLHNIVSLPYIKTGTSNV